jgi:uncharacterized membrane protein YqjE
MAEGEAPAGLLATLRGLLNTGLAIARTRLELLATEVREEQVRLLGLIAYGALSLIFLAAGLVFLAVFFTVLFWEDNRLLVLGIFSALFLAFGSIALLLARRHARAPSRLFAASLDELARDSDLAGGMGTEAGR